MIKAKVGRCPLLDSYLIKLTKAATGGVLYRKLFRKISQYTQETLMLESLLQLNQKKTPAQLLYCWEIFEEHLRTAASKLTLGSDCLELFLDCRFQNHPDSVILQKYKWLSNQSFKRNSAHMSSLYLTLLVLLNLRSICLSLTVTKKKQTFAVRGLLILIFISVVLMV